MAYETKAIIAMCFAIFSNSYGMAFVFSFAGLLVVEIGAADNRNDSGYYAGYITSAFMLGRVFSAGPWGYVADKYGRKPVILIGLIALIVFSFLLGLATNLFMAIAVRFLGGIFNGLVATAKTMASELCTEEHHAFCMGLVTGLWGSGLVVGPALSGIVAFPAEKYPNLFSPNGVFGIYPFLLPCVISTIIACVSFCVVLVYLPETLNNDQGYKPITSVDDLELDTTLEAQNTIEKEIELEVIENQLKENNGFNGSEDESGHIVTAVQSSKLSNEEVVALEKQNFDSSKEFKSCETSLHPMPVKRSLSARILQATGFSMVSVEVLTTIAVYGYYSFVCIFIDEVIPLWALSTKSAGGLEYEVDKIGRLLATNGICIVFYQFILYPRISPFMNPKQQLAIGSVCAAAATLLIPYSIVGVEDNKEELIWLLEMITNGLRASAQVLGFTGISLICNNATPTHARGKINGIAMSVGSFFKMLGPTIGSIVYAWSISYPPEEGKKFGFINYRFSFLFSAMLYVGTAGAVAYFIPDKFNHAFEENVK